MGGLSIWHILVVIVLFVLLFGRGKISSLMGDVASGIKSFKKGMREEDADAAKAAQQPPQVLQQPANQTAAPAEKRDTAANG